MISLFVICLAKKGLMMSQSARRHRFVASALMAGMAFALALTIDWHAQHVLADSVSCGTNEITFTSGGFNQQPAINTNGTRIAFRSNRDLTGDNGDGNVEIFLFDTTAKSFTQVTVKNFGPDSAIGAVINDTLSSGVTFVSAQASKGSFAAPTVGQTGTVTWNLGNLQNGDQEAAQIKVTVIIRGKTTITNTANVSSSTNDPNSGNNSSSLTTTVQSGGKK
jgi:uncharacterized repeat protein (TIGR01451 family)